MLACTVLSLAISMSAPAPRFPMLALMMVVWSVLVMPGFSWTCPQIWMRGCLSSSIFRMSLLPACMPM